jgi:hypothetical protein
VSRPFWALKTLLWLTENMSGDLLSTAEDDSPHLGRPDNKGGSPPQRPSPGGFNLGKRHRTSFTLQEADARCVRTHPLVVILRPLPALWRRGQSLVSRLQWWACQQCHPHTIREEHRAQSIANLSRVVRICESHIPLFWRLN